MFMCEELDRIEREGNDSVYGCKEADIEAHEYLL
jgi:hypothetical protein